MIGRAIKELRDLEIEVVTVAGVDSRHSGFDAIAAMYGVAAEMDRKEAGYRTRRGLEGLARHGKPTGGRSFGYVSAAVSGTGQVEIEPEHAAVVRRIFTMYADGVAHP